MNEIMKNNTVGFLVVAIAFLLNACQPTLDGSAKEVEFLAQGDQLHDLEGFRIKAFHSADGARILVSSETQGLLLVDNQGEVLDSAKLGDSKSFDILLGHEAREEHWVAFVNETSNSVELKNLVDDQLVSVTWPQNWATALAAVCLSDGGLTSKAGYDNSWLFAWVITQSGIAHQLLLNVDDGSVYTQSVRQLALGEGVSQCVVDDRYQRFYWAQDGVGLLSLNSDPEEDEERRLIDSVTPSDFQIPIERDVLLANDQRYLYSYSLAPSDLSEKKHFAIFSQSFSSVSFLTTTPSSGEGLFWAMTDEGDQLYRSRAQSFLAAVPDLRVDDTFYVLPSIETQPVESVGDAADDPEIWLNRDDQTQSLILATDKKSGLWVYELNGRSKQFLNRGRLNNVDIRYDVDLVITTSDIAMATNRTTHNIDLYTIDSVSGRVVLLADDLIDDSLGEPYGGCLYTSAKTGKTHFFVNNKDGLYQQWQLDFDADHSSPKAVSVSAKKVREFSLQGQPEGCVADDQYGIIYLGEENRGIWKIDAEASENVSLELVDDMSSGHLIADVEGMSLYLQDDGRGYLVVSSQGDNAYVLYDRQNNAYLGRFRVFMNAEMGIDGSSETDGLAVSSGNFGGQFSRGLLVVQDGRNRLPDQRQNFKLVSWALVEKSVP